MEKLRFEFIVKAKPEDNKTNIYAITLYGYTNQTFVVPREYQAVHLHKEIIKHEIFDKIKNLQKRHDKRQVWITLTKEMKSTYLDDDNLQFDGFLLEKLEQSYESSSTAPTLSRKTENKTRLATEFSIQKFSRNTTNVKQWLDTFESECTRLQIDTDLQKVEILRLLLEDTCTDWYTSMIIKHTIDSDWLVWKKSLIETFVDKSWSPIRYAMNFKYIQGSMLEYALKKERLLLEINKSIDTQTLIYLIAIGLPNFIMDRIDREDLQEVNDLYNCIRGLENQTKKLRQRKSSAQKKILQTRNEER
ncbi:hypothetical protein EVAR_88330_1 [Eumeta japonica]|uniref:Uncharacterized protein n=1 Tax=Eumeta variegata TaxID=151549 RepID=A0A4C1YBP4_EUMVA|nr:hypothetical protein EVAR_88330_1 [Eumeta japonica]